jgi:glycosyltransferase involved in cell wall biosynthesis
MKKVSIVIPCYNEEKTIRLLLLAISEQTYPLSDIEVIIADGMSTDRTREEIDTFILDHPDLAVKVVDNRARVIPVALNTAIKASTGDFIVRLDAHSIPSQDYVAQCIADLEKGLGDNVGGIWEITPGGLGWMAESIAIAAKHPLGVGDAHYRFTERAQEVDTVPFGSYRRNLIERMGGYDETLLTNEDYEFNVRIRREGGKIWLNPAIRSTYYSRPDIKTLAKQYWRYGYWKVRMLRRYPDTVRWRQAIPPLFTLSLIILGILSVPLTLPRWILAVEVVSYALTLMTVGIKMTVKEHKLFLLFGFPLAVMTMHFSWGTAFLWSLLSAFVSSDSTYRRTL